ncbi:TIM barrel protein [Mobiluncus mulieris]|uniref:TIM barrel protein n=1 Tax=Mobiluncus mulieris TaxID=2052 RepID=UPI0028937314|nr:TIM barrel protein [Mobiluncus mulieris]
MANDGNRYIVNPPGVDARVHQHNELGQGEVNWEMLFTALREVGFDGVFSVCIFGWHEWADEMNQRVLTRL